VNSGITSNDNWFHGEKENRKEKRRKILNCKMKKAKNGRKREEKGKSSSLCTGT
jgi:hypothetical protein